MPEAGMLFCCHSSCAEYNFKIQNPPVVGWRQVLYMTPSTRQSPKENKLKLWPKIHVLQCTLYALMNLHLGF
jgi:hypothetical protein